MKLRNKKTGEIKEFVLFDGKNELQGGASLAELNAEWEDYKPAEPLIKDEKRRKAVRAWAEAFKTESLEVSNDFTEFWFEGYLLEFEKDNEHGPKRYGYQFYTIAELCGEEE